MWNEIVELFLIDFSIKTLWQRLADEHEKIFGRCDTTKRFWKKQLRSSIVL